jgi:hypothetical protein
MTPNGLPVLFASLIESGWVAGTQGVRTWASGDGAVMIDVGDTGPTSGYSSSKENSYDHYVRMFEEGRYSLLLSDGGLAALTYRLKGHTITWHRFCYVPPVVPLNIAEGETVDSLPAADQYLLTPRRTMLRFEYDPANQAERHPYSHLHINSAECRIPVSGALSVKDFLFALVDLFYPQFLSDLGPVLRPTQPSIAHIAAEDKLRLVVKVPL